MNPFFLIPWPRLFHTYFCSLLLIIHTGLCGGCMHTCVGTCGPVDMHVEWEQYLETFIIALCFLLYYLETVFFFNWIESPPFHLVSSWNPPVPVPKCWRYSHEQPCPSCCLVVGDLNSGPHAHRSSTLIQWCILPVPALEFWLLDETQVYWEGRISAFCETHHESQDSVKTGQEKMNQNS